jgi:drug/metabolite transporter (DMT)-like permease
MLRYLATPDRVPDGFTANMIRYPVAALCYLPFLILGIRSGKIGKFWLAALLPCSFNLIAQTLWAWSFYYLDAGLIGFMIRLSLIWSILGAFILFSDERRLARSPMFWTGAVLSFAGFIAMSLLGNSINASYTSAGIIIIFVCGIFWGGYGVTARYTMKDLNPLVTFAVISLYTSIGLVAIFPLGDPGSVTKLNPFDFCILIVSALTGIAMAHGLLYFAMQRIGVAISMFSLMAAPFVTKICANIFLHESFTPSQWIGGLILIIGSAFALRSQQYLQPIDIAAAEVMEP